MSFELEYDHVSLEAREAENRSETVVEGSLTLPEGAAPISRVLQLKATPRVSEVEVKDDKVVFEGVCDAKLIYVHVEEVSHDASGSQAADEEDADGERDEPQVLLVEHLREVTWDGELPFVFILELPGVREGQGIDYDVKVAASSLETRADQVTLDVDVAIELSAWVDTVREATLASGVRPDEGVDLETREVRLRSLMGQGKAEVSVEGELQFTGPGHVDKPLSLQADAEVVEATVEDGQVRVKGYVAYGLLYTDAERDAPQYTHWPRGVAFEADIPVEGARRGAQAEISLTASESRYVVTESGKALDVYTPVQLDVRVVQTRRVPLITDISAEEKEIAVRLEKNTLIEAVGEGSVSETTEASLDVDDEGPGVERVLKGDAKVFVEDVHVLGDRVAIELRADVEMLYVGHDDGVGGVYVNKWPGAVTVDLEVPVVGAEPGLERTVAVKVQRVEFDPINRSTVDVRLELVADVKLQREIEVESIVEAVEVPQTEENPPTYTFVLLQPGDTLWKVAARYRSDVDAIAAVNPWLQEESTGLPAGRKLCVPRRMAATAG